MNKNMEETKIKFIENARYELINILIDKYEFNDYLEIGYQQGINYNKINSISNSVSSSKRYCSQRFET